MITHAFRDGRISLRVLENSEACGWWNSHLYAFRTRGRNGEEIAGVPFGDDWQHREFDR